MAKLTKRQRIHVRSYIHLALILLAAAAVIGGGIYLANRNRSSAAEPAADMSATIEQTPAAGTGTTESGTGTTESETGTNESEPTPEPTPTPAPLPTPPEVELDSWELRYVSSSDPLPADYAPELMELEAGEYFDNRAGMHLQKLIQDARDAGYTVYICSGYRSYETQSVIYWNHVEEYESQGMTREEAEAATRIAVNPPGGSEHQLGLAADILEYKGQEMEPWIGGSGLMLWLEEHCADYGFIIRYPEGKTEITGVEYEPWHLRFVGACARYIMENDLCLEEFLALYQ